MIDVGCLDAVWCDQVVARMLWFLVAVLSIVLLTDFVLLLAFCCFSHYASAIHM